MYKIYTYFCTYKIHVYLYTSLLTRYSPYIKHLFIRLYRDICQKHFYFLYLITFSSVNIVKNVTCQNSENDVRLINSSSLPSMVTTYPTKPSENLNFRKGS